MKIARFEVITAILLKVQVMWVITLRNRTAQRNIPGDLNLKKKNIHDILKFYTYFIKVKNWKEIWFTY
jgi:hypothetical protein